MCALASHPVSDRLSALLFGENINNIVGLQWLCFSRCDFLSSLKAELDLCKLAAR